MNLKKIILCLVFSSLFLSACSTEPRETESIEEAESLDAPTLHYIKTHSLPEGTHRPEILVEGEKLYLLVVEKEEDISHKGYIYDASDPSAIDFEKPEKEFVVSRVSEEYGSPADHRAVIQNEEIWVVYQNIILAEEYQEQILSGPMEQYLESQSLLLARFSLGGEELLRTKILTTTDFDEDTFPDMSIISYGENILVNTGAGEKTKMREVNSKGEILQSYEYAVPEEIASKVGNSLFLKQDGSVLVFDSTRAVSGEQDLSITALTKDFETEETLYLASEEREQTFSTGVVYHDGYYYVSYSTRDSSEPFPIEENPLSPALLILNDDFKVVYDTQLSKEFGSGHVHTNIAIIDNHLFIAWSQKVTSGTRSIPQVIIEEYIIEE